MSYPIIRNCNFNTRDDERGQAIHAARQAVEAGRTSDEALVDALDVLEETLTELADQGDVESVETCREAEQVVAAEWAVVGKILDQRHAPEDLAAEFERLCPDDVDLTVAGNGEQTAGYKAKINGRNVLVGHYDGGGNIGEVIAQIPLAQLDLAVETLEAISDPASRPSPFDAIGALKSAGVQVE